MAKNHFWYFGWPKTSSKYAEWVLDKMKSETIICPLDDGHQHGGKRLTNLNITLPGKSVEDFVRTWYGERLIQDHVLDLFKSNKFTGFDVKPVKAAFKRNSKQAVPKLWELIVTGWAGVAPPETGIKVIEDCKACGHMTYSEGTNPEKLIDTSQWDGSDFFIVWPLPNYIFVTDRVAQLIRDHQLTGVVLQSPDQLDLSGGFIPGRLSYVMPENRARLLGAALGIE